MHIVHGGGTPPYVQKMAPRGILKIFVHGGSNPHEPGSWLRVTSWPWGQIHGGTPTHEPLVCRVLMRRWVEVGREGGGREGGGELIINDINPASISHQSGIIQTLI